MPSTLVKEDLPAQSLSCAPKTRVDWDAPVTVIDLPGLKNEIASATAGQPKLIYIDGNIDFGPSDGAIAIAASKVIKIASTPGQTYALDAQKNSNIINITSTATVELYLENIILKNGFFGAGGAIFVNGENAAIILQSNAILEHNETEGQGGAILIYGQHNSIEVQDGAIIRHNRAADTGGGLDISGQANSASSTITIRPGSLIDDNTAGYVGGGINVHGGSLVIEGGVISNNRAKNGGGVYFNDAQSYNNVVYMNITGGVFTKNTASSSGGGIYTNNALDVKISGNTQITYNKAVEGSGIFTYIFRSGRQADIDNKIDTRATVDLLLSEDVQISHNTAENGGGLLVQANTPATVSITDRVRIDNNTATQDGGGMYLLLQSYATFDIADDSYIDHNNAGRDGGGIYVSSNEFFTVDFKITGSTHIEFNDAGRDGGGIYRPFQPIEELRVSENVVFNGNHASVPYSMTDAQDIAAQAPYILTHHLTAPFIYAYNNYDINYKGSPVFFGVAQARMRVCWSKCGSGCENTSRFLVGLYDCKCQLVARAVYDGTEENVTFSPVLLTKPDIYCYTMRMVCSNVKSMYLDQMPFSVCFNVTQGKDGELAAEIKYPQGRPYFQNIYMGP